LWSGQTISALGDGAFVTALAWEVLLLTGSATAMGLVVIAQTLPMLLFLLIGGVTADRLPRRLVMLWSDGGRAVAVLLIAALGAAHLLQLWHLVLLALFFGTVRGFFMPAYQSIIPQLVSKEHLASANSLTELSYQLYASLGPLLGAACVALTGSAGAFTFDGLTFLISAACLVTLRLPSTTLAQAPVSKAESRSGIRGVTADMREGLKYVAGSPFLWITMLLGALSAVGGAGSLVVALPKLVHDVYGQGVWFLGIVSAAGGIGALIAIPLSASLGRMHKRGMMIYVVMMIASLGLILFGLPLPRFMMPFIACIGMVLVNLGLAIGSIIWITLMQELVPEDKLGRVSSIDQLGAYGLWPVGFAIAGLVADHFSPSLVFIGAGILNLALYGAALCKRDIRRVE